MLKKNILHLPLYIYNYLLYDYTCFKKKILYVRYKCLKSSQVSFLNFIKNET